MAKCARDFDCSDRQAQSGRRLLRGAALQIDLGEGAHAPVTLVVFFAVPANVRWAGLRLLHADRPA